MKKKEIPNDPKSNQNPIQIVYLHRDDRCVGSIVVNDLEAMGDILSLLGPTTYLGKLKP